MNRDASSFIGSVTVLLEKVKDGLDGDAAQRLYERYVRQLEWVARGKLAGSKRAIADEEDVAITVLGQFFLGVRNGRFPKLSDRHDLWQVLLVVLERRVIDLRRKPKAEVGESALFITEPEGFPGPGMQEVPGIAVTPETLAILHEQLHCRLRQLPKERWRQVAIWKLEQRTNAEIARLLDCTVRQVERILSDIREAWQAASR